MSLVPRNNPLLAAVLSLLVVGTGHLYLGRWLRGLGWAAFVIGVGAAFVPEGTLVALRAGEAVDPAAIAPAVLVAAGGAADAFAVAIRQGPSAETPANAQTETACPECGRETDAGLEFCQWCTADLDRPASAESGHDADG